MKFALGTTALLAVGASAFAPAKNNAGPSALFSTAAETYTFTKSEEIFAEAKEVGKFTTTTCNCMGLRP